MFNLINRRNLYYSDSIIFKSFIYVIKRLSKIFDMNAFIQPEIYFCIMVWNQPVPNLVIESFLLVTSFEKYIHIIQISYFLFR